MRTSALFDAKKISEFSKFMVCPHEQGDGGRGVEPVRTLYGRGS